MASKLSLYKVRYPFWDYGTCTMPVSKTLRERSLDCGSTSTSTTWTIWYINTTSTTYYYITY